MYPIYSKKLLKYLLATEFQQQSFPCEYSGEKTPFLLLHLEPPILYIITLFPDDMERLPVFEKQLSDYLQRQVQTLPAYRCTNLISLSIILGENRNADIITYLDKTGGSIKDNYHQVWWYATKDKKSFYAPKEHPTALLRIEKSLLLALSEEEANESRESFLTIHQKAKEIYTLPQKSMNTHLILALFGANLIVFLWMLANNNRTLLFTQFGCDSLAILQQHQWYRLITSLFLHNDIMHLLQNALYLFFFGNKLEILLGKEKLLFVYLLSGIGGGILSIFIEPGLSVGASGAIFGLVGGVFAFSKYYGNRNIGMPYTTLLLFIAIGLLIGFLEPNVDNMAHLGGFFTGAILTYLLLKTGDNPTKSPHSPVEKKE